jgi:hypothetical protein
MLTKRDVKTCAAISAARAQQRVPAATAEDDRRAGYGPQLGTHFGLARISPPPEVTPRRRWRTQRGEPAGAQPWRVVAGSIGRIGAAGICRGARSRYQRAAAVRRKWARANSFWYGQAEAMSRDFKGIVEGPGALRWPAPGLIP